MRETVERILAIEREQERRANGALANYNAGKKKHKKQIAFLFVCSFIK